MESFGLRVLQLGEREMSEAFLGFGSNIGCKVGNIRRAVQLLKQVDGIEEITLSSFYKTEPIGHVEQDWFVNAVARIVTTLSPLELLEQCLAVERELKRVRKERWGPRTLDIDILLFDDTRICDERLEVPHPRFMERAFVLRPLLELSPSLQIDGIRLSERLESLGEQGVERLESVVVLLGASEKPDRFSNKAQKALMDHGYRVVPVTPRGDSVLGVEVLRSILDCNDPVDTLTLYVGSARLPDFLPEILAIQPRRVLFNPGTENESVRAELAAFGIETIEDCTLVMLRENRF